MELLRETSSLVSPSSLRATGSAQATSSGSAGPYRARAYERAIEAVRGLEGPSGSSIAPTARRRAGDFTAEDAAALYRAGKIGKSIRATFLEFVQTGYVTGYAQAKRVVRARRELGAISGVGPTTVNRWIGAGIMSRGSLRRAVRAGTVRLTHAQKLGLKYHRDLARRIPRVEVARIGDEVTTAALSLDRKCTVEIAGSYRRGNADSGDVDILISSARFRLERLIDALPRDKVVAVVMSGSTRLTFLFRSAKYVRQVDILLTKPSSAGAALLYLTGSGPFNERMRGQAKALGLRLNQLGLFRSQRCVAGRTEREVFAALGTPYLEPWDR